MPFYRLAFRKHYKNQLIFNDFVSMSTIFLHRIIVRLNPKNVKFHWFSMVFWFLRFGPKSTSWGISGPLESSRCVHLDVASSTCADFRKWYNSSIEMAQNVFDNDFKCAHVASKSRARVEVQLPLFLRPGPLFCIFRCSKIDEILIKWSKIIKIDPLTSILGVFARRNRSRTQVIRTFSVFYVYVFWRNRTRT